MDFDDDISINLKLAINKKFHVEEDIWLVPCIASYANNTYKPLLGPCPLKNSELVPDQYGWTENEDNILRKIVAIRGPKAWTRISNELNSLVHNGVEVRKRTNCRERWINHLNPGLKKGPWSAEEDRIIEEQYRVLGKKWSKIAKKMKGRTENSVKNRCLWLIKKQKLQKLDSPGLKGEVRRSPRIRKRTNESYINDNKEKAKEMASGIVIRPIKDQISNKNRVRSVRNLLRKAEGPIESTPSPSIFLMNS